MDSESMATPVLPGEVQCILCADVINFNNGNEDMFFGHMKNHHKVSINHIFVFGIHFMDDHSVGQIVDNFKQDYYDLININKDKGVNDYDSFENEKLLDEQDFESIDDQTTLSNITRSNEKSISTYIKKIVEYPPEKCDECANEFNVRYKKCVLHKSISSKRKYNATNESHIKGDKFSRKVSASNYNGVEIQNSSPTKNTFKSQNDQTEVSVTEDDIRNTDVSDNLQFNCDMCDKQFCSKGNLRRHIKIIHNINKTMNKGNDANDINIFGDEKLLDKEDQNSIDGRIDAVNSDSLNNENPNAEDYPIIAMVERSTIENSEYFKKYPNQILSKLIADRSTFDIIDGTLPEGWRVKKRTRTRTKSSKSTDYYIYLSPDGKILRSRAAVVEYMKIMDIYSIDQLEIAKIHYYRNDNFSVVSSSSSKDTSSVAGTVAITGNNYGEYGDDSMSEYIDNRRITNKTEDGIIKLDEAVKQKITLGVGLNDKRLWQCTDCDYSHKRKDNVVNHIESKHLNEKVFCKLCNIPFSTRDSLRKHLKDRHKDGEKHEDNDSVDDQMEAFNIDELLEETDQTEDFNIVSSSSSSSADIMLDNSTITNDSYNYRQNNNGSMSEYNEDEEMIDPTSCEDRNKKRDEAVKLKITLVVGHNGERLWRCTDCDYSHIYKYNTITHVETKHLNEKVFCELCNAFFLARKYLKRHLKKVHKDSNDRTDTFYLNDAQYVS